MNVIQNSPQSSQKPVTGRYLTPKRINANALRLRAIVRLFRLSPNSVAQATGFSRPYVARLLSANDDFKGSAEFYRTLEAKLGAIIDQRASQYFTVPAVSVQRARGILEGMPEPVGEMERAA